MNIGFHEKQLMLHNNYDIMICIDMLAIVKKT